MYSGLDRLYLDVVISASNAHSDGNHRSSLPIRDLARLLAKPMGDIRLHLQELRSVLLVPYHADHPICGYWTDFGLNWPITEVFPPFFVSANEREKSEPSLREAL
jgi:hypothetical protein